MGDPSGGIEPSCAAAVPLGIALRPLSDRYVRWQQLDAEQVLADRVEAARDIRAMQLVLRMERTDPPSWHRALAGAASAAASLCLDPRSEVGGEWHDAVVQYCLGHIRKVTRRARGAHWIAAQELPGITIDLQGTQLRALVPGRVIDLDPRISRLQVGGTDVAPDEPPDSDAEPAAGLSLWVAAASAMTLGKAMAQAGHAGMIAAALLAADDQSALARWAESGCVATARRATSSQWTDLEDRLREETAGRHRGRLLAVRDAGFTEVPAGTITVIARCPR